MAAAQQQQPSPKRPINLLRGWPASSLLPAHLISAAAQRSLANPDIYVPALEYGPDAGYQPLREALAGWLGEHYYRRPDSIDPERICITGGASQSLASLLQSYTDPSITRAVWLVAPVFHLICPIFEDAGFAGRLNAVPEDEDGLDVALLETKLRALEEKESREGFKAKPFKAPGPERKLYKHVIYVIPSCSNPSGKTMSLGRRRQLVLLARKYDALIVSDDVYDFLQWRPSSPDPTFPEDARLPRLSDIDREIGIPEGGFGNAISNGTLSKIAGPGVRTGWVEGTEAFAFGLSQTGNQKSGGAPSQLTGAILSDVIQSGQLKKYVDETVRPSLHRRHRVLLDALRKHVAPAKAEFKASSLEGADIFGGYFVWVTLNSGFSSDVISRAAQEEENLIIGGGNIFQVKGDETSARFDDKIRLTFSWVDEADLTEGMERLGALLLRVAANPEHYAKYDAIDSQGFVDSHK